MNTEYKLGEIGERPWGTWEVIEVSNKHIKKRIELIPERSISLQYHNCRCEIWEIIEGTADIICDKMKATVTAPCRITIPVGSVHKLTNAIDKPLVVIETQLGNYLGEDDIIRLD